MLRSFLDQLTKEQKTVLLSDPARYAAVLSGMNTNMDAAFMEEWGKLLMKYGTYPKTEITYTTRDATIRAFKEADR
jgi:hypothetical protein